MTPTRVSIIPTNGPGEDDDLPIVLDASESESHQSDVDVTDHPVEVGADVTDHARVKPDQLTITGVFSNTRIIPGEGGGRGQVVGVSGVQPIVSGTGTSLGEAGYADYAYKLLLKIKDERKLCRVTTGLRFYTSMILTALHAPRDSRTGEAVRVTLTFKEVRFVQIRRELVPVAKLPAARGKNDIGAKVAKPPTDKESQIYGGASDLLPKEWKDVINNVLISGGGASLR